MGPNHTIIHLKSAILTKNESVGVSQCNPTHVLVRARVTEAIDGERSAAGPEAEGGK